MLKDMIFQRSGPRYTCLTQARSTISLALILFLFKYHLCPIHQAPFHWSIQLQPHLPLQTPIINTWSRSRMNYAPPCLTISPKNCSRLSRRTFPNNHRPNHRHRYQVHLHQLHLPPSQPLHCPVRLHHHSRILTAAIHLHRSFHTHHNHHRVMLLRIHILEHHAPHSFAHVAPSQSTTALDDADDAP